MKRKSVIQISANKSISLTPNGFAVKKVRKSSQEVQRRLEIHLENTSLIKNLTLIHNRRFKPVFIQIILVAIYTKNARQRTL